MTPGPIVGLVVGIVLIFVISTASIGIMTLRWYRKHDRKESVDEKLSSKLEMGAQIEFSGRQPKHNRASMLLGVSKDSINLTRPKFTIRRQKKTPSPIPSSHHTMSWVINHSPTDCSLRELQEDFQRRYDSTETRSSVPRLTLRASVLYIMNKNPATPISYVTDAEQLEEKCAQYEGDTAIDPQALHCLDYLSGLTKGRTMSAYLLGNQLQTVAIHVPMVVALATHTRHSITPIQSGTSLESFAAFARQLDYSLERTIVTRESECLWQCHDTFLEIFCFLFIFAYHPLRCVLWTWAQALILISLSFIYYIHSTGHIHFSMLMTFNELEILACVILPTCVYEHCIFILICDL